jgi:hypothetical protein
MVQQMIVAIQSSFYASIVGELLRYSYRKEEVVFVYNDLHASAIDK